MRFCLASILAVWALAACSAPVSAQPTTTTASLSADIPSLAKLTLSTTSLTFPDANPDLVSEVPPIEGLLSITAKARATSGSQVLLTVEASDDLRSGVQVIAASAITWTASGAGFVGGTLSATTPVPVAQWIGSGIRTGTQSLVFQNLWTYAAGTYSCSLVYTLTAP